MCHNGSSDHLGLVIFFEGGQPVRGKALVLSQQLIHRLAIENGANAALRPTVNKRGLAILWTLQS